MKILAAGIDGICIPPHLMEADVPLGAKILWGLVRAIERRDSDVCYATNAELSESLGVTPRAVQNWISSLEKSGFMERGYYDVGRALFPRRFFA